MADFSDYRQTKLPRLASNPDREETATQKHYLGECEWSDSHWESVLPPCQVRREEKDDVSRHPRRLMDSNVSCQLVDFTSGSDAGRARKD